MGFPSLFQNSESEELWKSLKEGVDSRYGSLVRLCVQHNVVVFAKPLQMQDVEERREVFSACCAAAGV